jgi:hypothetical protein
MLPRRRTGLLPIFVKPDTLRGHAVCGRLKFREQRGPAEFHILAQTGGTHGTDT